MKIELIIIILATILLYFLAQSSVEKQLKETKKKNYLINRKK